MVDMPRNETKPNQLCLDWPIGFRLLTIPGVRKWLLILELNIFIAA